MTAAQEEPIPISLVAHYVFCPRRAWLEAVGEKTDTAQMAVGIRDHSASDDPTRSRQVRIRAVDVASERLGVVGRCDCVEFDETARATVVEHKATPVRRKPEVTDPTRVQLALQVGALREQDVVVAGAAVYFTSHRVRVPVEIGDVEVDRARQFVAETAALIRSHNAPEPLEDDPRCSRCSHVDVCLPDERRLQPVRRRVLVADPDSQVLHLATPGSRASVSRRRVEVGKGEEKLGSIPLERVQAVVVHGNVDLSGALIRELLFRSLPVVWCSGRGRIMGWAVSADSPNGLSRVRQHVASASGRLDLAREFVTSKIANQATMLRRHGQVPETVQSLRLLQRRATTATSLTELYGIEGDAAAGYFAGFESMLRRPGVPQAHAVIRTRRPAQDPVNAALNYAYGMLVADVIRAIASAGLDPHAGFLHSSARNKPALALDLCEEFRAPVADSVVLTAFNNGELKPEDFVQVLDACHLREGGRKTLIAAYERRVVGLFRHPVFEYEVTWRRAMEIQARMILGVLDGTQPRYVGIKVR